MIYIVLGRALLFGLALLSMKVATTILSPVEFGKLAVITTTTAFFALLLINPVGMFINRRLHTWQTNGKLKIYFYYYLGYLILISLLASFSILIFDHTQSYKLEINIYWLILLVCTSLIFNTINQTSIPSLNLLGYTNSFLIFSLATAITSFLLAFLFSKLWEPTSSYWQLGVVTGQLFFGILGTMYFFEKTGKSTLNKTSVNIKLKNLKFLFSFAWPISIAAGLNWAQTQGYRFIINNILGMHELGIFAAGYVISAGIIIGCESILTTYLQPKLYKEASTNQVRVQASAWSEYASIIFPSSILTVALIISLSVELEQMLLGNAFESSRKFIVWGALSEFFRVLISTYSLIPNINLKTKWLIFPNLFGALFSGLLCLILIPIYGAIGAGISLVVSGFLVTMYMHISLAKKVTLIVPVQKIMKALFQGATLIIIAFVLRDLCDFELWIKALITVFTIGTIFLILQYSLFKTSLAFLKQSKLKV